MENSIEIDYDDGLMEILEKIDGLLKDHNLITSVDKEDFDGFEVVRLKRLK